MKDVKLIIQLFIILFVISSCSEYLDPMLDGTAKEEDIYENNELFRGELNRVYNSLDNTTPYIEDCATDNAVSNNFGNDYLKMGTGALTPLFNPTNTYVNCYRQIRRLNTFLEHMVLDSTKSYLTPVRFVLLGTTQDSLNNMNMFYRIKGEAYFLRAMFEFELLQHFGGKASDGEVYGFPIVTDVIDYFEDNLNLPRNTYLECVQQILDDCDSAYNNLPLVYSGGDVMLGAIRNGRGNGIAALALKARTLLYAASPAYGVVTYEEAAIAAGEALSEIGGLANLQNANNYYFAKLNNATYDDRDIFFRGLVQNNRNYESDNYPPSLYGNGLVNPSQNFVDAFADKDGYPISESVTYNSQDPYVDRDPRLKEFVGVNADNYGPNNYVLKSTEGEIDAFNPSLKTSRTNYYLKKLLKNTVNLTPGNLTSTQRTHIKFGAPELYLNYAEAAFEAWGATGDPYGYGTAQTALQKIHLRYGSSNTYLDTEAIGDPVKFRALVRNERRIELSFEGHYFWDLRRWATDLSKLNVDVYGVKITGEPGAYTYNYDVVEKRIFQSQYMPIPLDELYNANALVQNQGW
jgi:starch-binding outer membrane protein, SusD/RagB family